MVTFAAVFVELKMSPPLSLVVLAEVDLWWPGESAIVLKASPLPSLV
jgi:hypothetical protein